MNFNINELQLIHFSDPRMMVKPPEFDFEKDQDKAEELVDVLHKKMLQLGGSGLSANQVGLPYRMFVIGNKDTRQAFFNPNIVGVSSEKSKYEEGCVSMPGFFLTLLRPKSLSIECQNEKGETVSAVYTDIPARIILHEYDHMEGINFTQHASNFKLRFTLDRFKKQQRKFQKRVKYGK